MLDFGVMSLPNQLEFSQNVLMRVVRSMLTHQMSPVEALRQSLAGVYATAYRAGMVEGERRERQAVAKGGRFDRRPKQPDVRSAGKKKTT